MIKPIKLFWQLINPEDLTEAAKEKQTGEKSRYYTTPEVKGLVDLSQLSHI